MVSDTKKVIHIFRFKISCIQLGPIRALASFQGGCACKGNLTADSNQF